MTIAKEIQMTARNADAAMNAAEDRNPCVNQSWEDEATFYTFADGSVLAVSGPTVNAYGDAGEAVADFPSVAEMLV